MLLGGTCDDRGEPINRGGGGIPHAISRVPKLSSQSGHSAGTLVTEHLNRV